MNKEKGQTIKKTIPQSLDEQLDWTFHRNSPKLNDKREKLAEYAHDSWSGWMQYLFDKSDINEDCSVTIPPELVTRWGRQMNTAYLELPENEKESDLAEADKILAIIND